MRELAPNDQTWVLEDLEAFEASYLRQLEDLGPERILADLERIGRGRPVVMLCWERPGEFCHRRVLANFLRAQTLIEVPELEPGMLGRRPDAPQPALFE